MTGDFLSFGSGPYFVMFALLVFARGMDFLSTWLATPNLVLEGNPIARKLGWKWGAVANLILCATFALWPLTAIIVITAALLVAAHNFHSAWLMRSMGEHAYREWFSERLAGTRRPLFFVCLLGETGLTAIIGGALVFGSEADSIGFAIGFGIVAYGAIVLFYTLLSLWRSWRPLR